MRYYRISMSSKDKIVVDEDDFAKLEQNLGTGNLIRLKKGIVNPSFIVSIYPITQQEALAEEYTEKKIEGHIDEKTGKYTIDKQTEIIQTTLKDEFQET